MYDMKNNQAQNVGFLLLFGAVNLPNAKIILLRQFKIDKTNDFIMGGKT